MFKTLKPLKFVKGVQIGQGGCSMLNIRCSNSLQLPHFQTFELSNFFHHFSKHPATRYKTAILTASPLVTCSRITDCGPSAIEASTSTPRLIGPGCITNASGLRYFIVSLLRPKILAYSLMLGKYDSRWRSCYILSRFTTSASSMVSFRLSQTRTPIFANSFGTRVAGPPMVTFAPSLRSPHILLLATRL